MASFSRTLPYGWRGHRFCGGSSLETKALNRQVKRNLSRFPEDFMFQLTAGEEEALRYQNGTSKKTGKGGRRYLPYAFTEHGILILSSILNSSRASQINVHIIRTFVRQREFLNSHKDLKSRIDDLEKKYDRQFQVAFRAIKAILDDKEKGDFKNRRFES
ncbi:MAG: ORF6N domain-containing protein [Candidatus Omnitrophica bacterium]|nr:ORF6N domain-containing protein [Candidatus Omnitrophota bacterium]